MNLPSGNVFLKPTALGSEDLKQKVANLEQHGFNGYVKVETQGKMYYLFLKEGIVKSVVEDSEKSPSLLSQLLLYHALKGLPMTLSSFVLSSELVDVLSSWYAFQEKYSNYQVRKKEFKKVLSSLDSEKMTGVVEIINFKTPVYLLLNQGHIVTDSFLDSYGEIATGPEKVSQIIEQISTEGGAINTFGEKSEFVDRKGKQLAEELARYKELVAVVEAGPMLFGTANAVRVDENVLREWSRFGIVQRVDVVVGQEAPVSFKVTGKKGLGNKIALSASIQKKLELEKDEAVLVRPGYQ